MEKTYQARRIARPFMIDADWDKPAWRGLESVLIEQQMGEAPQFKPKTQVKLGWDEQNIYIIFKVDDQYVRAVATENFGSVWKDSCVEFFFTPLPEVETGYFNLETNCIGSILMFHQRAGEDDRRAVSAADLAMMQLATSFAKRQAIDPEITTPVTWTLEYSLPWRILTKYTSLTQPAAGQVWRGNFYKCVEENSHPHWLTWSRIPLPKPDFHRPTYFGRLEFTE